MKETTAQRLEKLGIPEEKAVVLRKIAAHTHHCMISNIAYYCLVKEFDFSGDEINLIAQMVLETAAETYERAIEEWQKNQGLKN